MLVLDNYIYRKRKSLSSADCQEIINNFNVSPYKKPNDRNYTLLVSSLRDYLNVNIAIGESLEEYQSKHSFMQSLSYWRISDKFHIQKYEPNEAYKGEHMEHGRSEWDSKRLLGWMFYLNDCNGGTRWPQQRFTTKPREGDLYIWPAGWTHSHYGLPATKEKYILTGWCEFIS